ncbi:MAG: DUF748 domain-containing protein [Nitrospiraceae bacterium]
MKKWALILLGLVALYALAGFFILPPVLKSQLETKLPATLHRAVAIEAIAFNPFTLTLDVKNFRATEPTGEEFLGFAQLRVDLEASSIVQRSLNFKDIRLVQPSVRFTLNPDGSTNFSNIGSDPGAAATPPPPAPPTEPSTPLLVRIDAFHLDDGRAHVEDQSPNKPYRTDIGPIDVEITNFKTDPDWRQPNRFTARMDPDTVLSWSGHFSVTPLWSEGTIELSGVHVPAFDAYYGHLFEGKLTDGTAALKTDYRLDPAGKGGGLSFDKANLTLAKLVFTDPSARAPAITIPTFAVNDLALDLSAHRVTIGGVRVADAVVTATRSKDGVMNLARLFSAPRTPDTTPPPVRVEKRAPPADGAKASEPSSPWSVAIAKSQIENLGVTFEDQGPTTPARMTLDQLGLTAQNFRYPNPDPMPTEASLRWNGQGTLALTGTMQPMPFSMDVDTVIKDFALTPLQPYIADQLYMELTSGALDATTHIVYGPSGADTTPLQLQCDLALLKFATKDSRSGESLAKFDALRLSRADIKLSPTRIAIEQLHLKNFQANASTTKDGGFNVTSLRRGAETAAPAPTEQPTQPAAAPAPDGSQYTIKNVVLENAAMGILDRTLQPPLSTGITQLTGRITNVSYPKAAKTSVDLTGKADGRAPLRITGHVDPKGPGTIKDSMIDLLVSLKGYDVPVFTGYSSKYVGYPFQKGKLSIDMKYGVADRKVNGENTVVVDQLTLGPKTDSPDATSLPVKLALAILTDRQGIIHLDVPVGGNLDDPEFTFGRVILRALLNILEKVATSPFALLGAIAGGGSDAPNTIDFAAGSAELADTELSKLGKLAKALSDRPALKLEVTASVDPERDRVLIAKEKVRKLLLEQKRAALATTKKRTAAAPAEEPTLDEVEYEQKVRELHARLMDAEQRARGKAAAGQPPAPGSSGQTSGATQSDQAAVPTPPTEEITLDNLPPPPPPPSSGFWGFLKKLNPFGSSEPPPPPPQPKVARPAAPTTPTETPERTPAGSGTQSQAGATGNTAPPLPPFAEVEAAVLAKQPVSADDLHQLQQARTNAIMSYLIEQGRLEADRVFPASGDAEATAAPSTQATLKLN